MTPAPCKDCKFRSYGCHSTCAKYIDWQQIHELEKNKKNETKNEYDMYAYRRNQEAKKKYGSRR